MEKPPPADQDAHDKAYDAAKADLFARQMSNAKAFDKAVLTLASAALGLSLAFIKDVAPPLSAARFPWLLYLSWWLLASTIVMTVASFLVSQQGIQRQLDIARRYHKERIEAAANEKNRLADATVWLNLLSGGAFIAAVIATTGFISVNIERASAMVEHQNFPINVPSPERIERGMPIPRVERLPARDPAQQTPATQPTQTTQPQAPPSQTEKK